jgi:hypothetical protein
VGVPALRSSGASTTLSLSALPQAITAAEPAATTSTSPAIAMPPGAAGAGRRFRHPHRRGQARRPARARTGSLWSSINWLLLLVACD